MAEKDTVAIPKGGISKSYQAIDEALNFRGTTEKTFWDTSYNQNSQFAPFNPDPLWQRDGDYTTYEDMLDDDQVDVAMQLKKDMVLGSGFEFVAGDEGQEEIVADLDRSFIHECPIPFEDKLEEVLTAYDFGFSASEKLFRKREDGTLAFGGIRTRHPNTWLFTQDPHGNIIKIEQRGSFGKGDVEIKNHGSILHYINRPRFQNAYGRSDLLSAFTAWSVKKEIVKFYAIYLEKAASPTPVGKYDSNVPQEAVDDIYDALRKLQTKTALVVPDAIDLEFLEADDKGSTYKNGIDLFNMFISRSLFVPDLLGFGGSETTGGSFSLGKEHMALFFKHIRRRRKTLETLVNRHFVRPIILFNFGDVENPPEFRFKPMSDQDAIDLAEVWLKAVNGKAYKASEDEVNHFRSLVKFPEGDVEFIKPSGGGFNSPGNPNTDLPDEDDAEKTANPEVDEDDLQQQAEDDVDKMGQFPKENKSNYARVFKPTPGDFSKRTDFQKIESQLMSATESTMDKVRPIIQEQIQDLAEQVERKKIIKNQDFEKIDTLKIKKLSDLKRILKNDLRDTFKTGMASGQSELIKGNFTLPLPNDAFLEGLDAETFQFIGTYDFKIKESTAILLRQAIKDGTPLSVVVDQMNEEFASLGEVSIERFSRTKTTEVFNRGRLEFFQQSGVVQGYQYSAILDDRTTAICSGLHGKFFKEGKQPVPPLHFNCRSLLIPVTKFEELKETTSIRGKTPDEFIDENKGKGFSKQ